MRSVGCRRGSGGIGLGWGSVCIFIMGWMRLSRFVATLWGIVAGIMLGLGISRKSSWTIVWESISTRWYFPSQSLSFSHTKTQPKTWPTTPISTSTQSLTISTTPQRSSDIFYKTYTSTSHPPPFSSKTAAHHYIFAIGASPYRGTAPSIEGLNGS